MELSTSWRDIHDILFDNIDNRVALMLVTGEQINGVLFDITKGNLVHLKEVSLGSRTWYPKDRKYDVVVHSASICGVVVYARRFKRGWIDREIVDEKGYKRDDSIEVSRWVDVEYKDGKFVDVPGPAEENVRWVN